MTYEVTTSGTGCQAYTCVLARGPIDEDSSRQLKAFARETGLRPGAVVLLDSPGGGTLAGVALGNQIRTLGLATRVERVAELSTGVCASACAYAFLGGVERSVAANGKLGVHQMASTPDGPYLSASDAQWAAGLIALHVDRMGADISFLTTALRTPPHRMHWLSSIELASTRGVTDATAAHLTRVEGGTRPAYGDASISMQAAAGGAN